MATLPGLCNFAPYWPEPEAALKELAADLRSAVRRVTLGESVQCRCWGFIFWSYETSAQPMLAKKFF